METVFLTMYVLVWPVVVIGTLTVIVRAFVKDARKARREGRHVV